MKYIFLNALLVAFIFQSNNSTAQDRIRTDDIKVILGDWKGTLTYLDYSSNEPFSMPANLNIKGGKKENQLVMYVSFPNEPHANNKEKIKVSRDGSKLNGHKVSSREELKNGDVQITTEHSGKDNRKKALIRNVYVFGENNFSMKKEVKFINSEDWIVRNEYKFQK